MTDNIKKSFLRFWGSPACVFWFGMTIVLLATSLEVFRGRNTNYFDYQDSTRMFWEGISPYTMEYAQAHCIYFLYSPVFNIIFAPIFMLPWWLGPFVWNIGNFCLFALAIKTLPEKYDAYKHRIFLFLLPVLLQAIFCYQHNTIVCYIFIFAYSLLERGKGFGAVLLIMISACTKVYGGAELAMLFLYPRTWRNFGYAILCGATLLALPLLNTNMDNPLGQYQLMFDMIANHHSDSDFIGILFARGLKPFLLPNYRIVQLSVLAILAIGFFSCFRRWKDFRFRAQSLAILMGFIILFSDCPETHTYLISLTGYSLAFWLQPNKKWFDWVLFWMLLFNFGILPTDVLCPAWIHEYIHQTFWLDIYTFTLCWLRTIWWAIAPKQHDKKKVITLSLLFFMPCASLMAQNVSATARPMQRTFIVKNVKFTMKYVQGGTYTMGARPNDNAADADESPRHRVLVNSFYIGETEVTQALWEAVMEKNRSRQKSANHPVEYVTYEDCQRFIEKLNSATGLHFRLPSEAEWEFAARGGRKSKGYIYSGSNNIDEVAHTLNNTPIFMHYEVAQMKPNELGLYDMSGNVWEWCEDFYGRYGGRKSDNFHIIRGGAHDCSPVYCRTTNRYMYDKRRRRDAVGLRLALSFHTILRNQ